MAPAEILLPRNSLSKPTARLLACPPLPAVLSTLTPGAEFPAPSQAGDMLAGLVGAAPSSPPPDSRWSRGHRLKQCVSKYMSSKIGMEDQFIVIGLRNGARPAPCGSGAGPLILNDPSQGIVPHAGPCSRESDVLGSNMPGEEHQPCVRLRKSLRQPACRHMVKGGMRLHRTASRAEGRRRPPWSERRRRRRLHWRPWCATCSACSARATWRAAPRWSHPTRFVACSTAPGRLHSCALEVRGGADQTPGCAIRQPVELHITL